MLLLQAELRKLLTRPSARACALALLLLGLAGPLALRALGGSGVSVNGKDVSEVLASYAVRGAGWSLALRALAGQAVLLLLAAQSFAGELQAHTLREELTRPVARSGVLAAKLGALATFSFGTQLAAALVAALAALVLLPGGGEIGWDGFARGLAGLAIAEVGFAATALAFSVVFRSPTGGLLAALALLAGERALRGALTVLGWMLDGLPVDAGATLKTLVSLARFAPSAGWDAWFGLPDASATWHGWAALASWTALSWLVATRGFARATVP